MASFADAVLTKGWAVTGPLLATSTLKTTALSLAEDRDGLLRGGMRNFLDLACVRELARSDSVRAVAASVLGPTFRAVRGLFFDKQPGANWCVPWHQDLTIAVRERREAIGFGPWSIKGGVHHVQAPAPLLAHLLAVRINLDDCRVDNGPLRLIPGSHRSGILSPGAIEEWIAEGDVEVGVAEAGSILAFRPLILHASSPASNPRIDGSSIWNSHGAICRMDWSGIGRFEPTIKR